MKHHKHLLGRYVMGNDDPDLALKHARQQFEILLKSKKGKELNDNWVELQVFLYDTESE